MTSTSLPTNQPRPSFLIFILILIPIPILINTPPLSQGFPLPQGLNLISRKAPIL